MCLTSAFYDDPLWGRWAFPETSSRTQRLYELLRAFAAAGVRHPCVRMTEHAEAVAVWVPPGESEMTTEEEQAFEQLITALLGPRAPDVQALLVRFEEHHPHEEPHFYLSLWGTHRDHAGRGLGSALIRESLAHIDAQRRPAYLESTNPANIPRYEALGFRRRDEFGPADGPRITTMWREAR